MNQNLKIFLLDNSAASLSRYKEYLTALGYSDFSAFSKSADFLNHLYNHPDVIFLDYHIDTLNGIDILKKIKRFNPNLPVIFISSQDDVNVAINALKYGAFDYIEKKDAGLPQFSAVLERVIVFKNIINRKTQPSLYNKMVNAVNPLNFFSFSK